MYFSSAVLTKLLENDFRVQDFLIGSEGYCQMNGGTRFVKAWTNLHFHAYKSADSKLDYLDSPDTRAKTVIIGECVLAVKERGGRFLERINYTDGTSKWQEVPESGARKAVLGAFRNHERNRKKRKHKVSVPHHTEKRRSCSDPVSSLEAEEAIIPIAAVAGKQDESSCVRKCNEKDQS